MNYKSAARALVIGLALLLPGTAMAGEPIDGVDVRLGKNPPGSVINVPVDSSGQFHLRLTEPGSYTLSTACRAPVCAPHSITASYPGNNNQAEPPIIAILIGLLLPAQTAFAQGNPIVHFTVDQRGAVINGAFKTAENESPQPQSRATEIEALGSVSTTRGTAPRPDGGDVKPGISDQGAAGNLSSYGTAPPPADMGSDGKLLGVTVAVTGVDDTLPDGPQNYVTAPCNPPCTTTTGADGSFHFDKLPAGKYKLTAGDQPAQSVTVGSGGTFSGTLIAGADGGMSITVSPVNDAPSARDPIGMDGGGGMRDMGISGGSMGGGPTGP